MEIPYLYSVNIGQLTPSPSFFTAGLPSNLKGKVKKLPLQDKIGGPPPPLSLHSNDRELPSNFDGDPHIIYPKYFWSHVISRMVNGSYSNVPLIIISL